MTDTITIPRADYDAMVERLKAYDALLEEMEDAADLAVAAERRTEETIPFELVERMLDGAHPVRVWREHRGLSQRALAKAAGLSPAMMSEIEAGNRSPSLTLARALAAALGVGLDDLFPSGE